ncbi:MAG: hypothetical protein AUK35_10960 [Zetaproteobacteria bacterium CG2_30_46_52]|nr:MAG: hypothetical protein AUK35_10960 [Zetaproteobacteria bacterium CG2_30_46_52]
MLSVLPFEWTMRLSNRAKYPRITINKFAKVELVWPKHMPQKHVKPTLFRFEPWVRKRLAEFEPHQHQQNLPPQSITLPAIQQTWAMRYQHQAGLKPAMSENNDALVIAGDLQDGEAIRVALQGWLKAKAKLLLNPWLKDVALDMGAEFSAISIRLQKRRWGSCSSKKRISLNAALLFLSPELVRHVLIHELAHLKHMNHSAAFWREVAVFDPLYKQHRLALRHMGKDTPRWLHETFDTPPQLKEAPYETR